ncbi:MAG: hypothetical protein ACI9LG_000820 [Moritella dasanensis]|jgi:hypothetical protein
MLYQGLYQQVPLAWLQDYLYSLNSVASVSSQRIFVTIKVYKT